MGVKDIGITVKKSENFSEWYIQVVTKAELADYSAVKGFMVLMPYGYSIWEKIQEFVDKKIKETGHRNAYFPSLIPESLLRKEAEHFSGFTPEVFWVTHTGDNKLGERLAARPTSETIAYYSYAKWIKSWRDLPLLLNFWNSVLRAEITSTKPFIRTSEFLWQEGHTVHETKEDADKEVIMILNLYRELIEDLLAIPVVTGMKTEREKFLGALYTTTLEAIMGDGKALQMGTSHNLGQNFSKPFEIKYLGRDGLEHYAWQTSWGVSWRLIGAVVMVHGDDKGLVLPPRIAPIQVVIVPIFFSNEERNLVDIKARAVQKELIEGDISVHYDDRTQFTPGWKFNEWEMKGVPLRIEIGPREVRDNRVIAVRRDTGLKISLEATNLVTDVRDILDSVQKNLFSRAKKFLEEYTVRVDDYSVLKRVLDERGGFIKACWCSSQECEDKIKVETGATIRVIPFNQEPVWSGCIYCGKAADKVVYFARAY
ncbi:MAG: proline--tRNA ligase [Candidatus Bathyarchaeia archaeon]|nr:proline--tRNA ligase [Candidatus Bathyarchaeota archaeon]